MMNDDNDPHLVHCGREPETAAHRAKQDSGDEAGAQTSGLIESNTRA